MLTFLPDEQPSFIPENLGYVKLVSSMGSDLAIIDAARVSFNSSGYSKRLLRYLLEHKHTSPFEHVVFTFEVSAPIFILRQWLRHRTWSYNELSARYAEIPHESYIPEMIGVASETNKQSREFLIPSDSEAAEVIQQSVQASFQAYSKLLSMSVPREVARIVLPVATKSRMFATVDLHNLLHFISLRNHSGAQYEMQLFAKELLRLITPIVPDTVEIWKELHEKAAS